MGDKEFTKYTPLMLAIAGGGSKDLECVRALLNKGVDFKVKDHDGNSVLHIAAIYQRYEILDLLCKNLKIELFQRNNDGETILSIVQKQGDKKGIDIMNRYKTDYDKSSKAADELLGELMKEEEDGEEAKAKRKQKKWRNKVNKIAKQEGKSFEEVEQRLLNEESLRKEEEEARKIEEQEKEKNAEIEYQRRKEEYRRQKEEERI